MECAWRILSLVIFVTVLLLDIATSQDISYHIFEEKPNSTIIGNVATDSNLFSVVGESDFSSLQFSIFDTNSKYFRIDNKTGILYTNDVLDRETICEYLETCLKTIQVAANSKLGSFFRTLKINVFIDDINDHSPEFEKQSLTLEISEAVLVGTSYQIEGATDQDTSQNYSLKYYELQSNNMPVNEELPFSIQFVKHLDGRSIVRLSVTLPLNREKRDMYSMEIVAKDGDNPPRTGVLPIIVSVLDVNNNPPVFTADSYDVSVNESLDIGSRIITVTATDKDADENGQIKYKVSPHQSSNIFQTFSINENSGAITLKEKLVYSPGKFYRIIVEAYDNPLEGQSLTAQTFVRVTVQNTGNNPPEIIINLLPQENNAAQVSEYANIGAVVAYITVNDHDVGQQGETACIVQSRYFALERHDNYINKYKVVTADLLDYEKRQQENVTIICQDGGTPALQSKAWFVVEIKDENDHPPLFEEDFYQVTIPENIRTSEVILSVTASDLDQGNNSQFHFVVSEPFQDEFKFDEPSSPTSKTGYLRVNKELDRETKPRYVFQIYVVDHGSPPKTGTATLSIHLDDVNDKKPVFTSSLFNFTVLENLDPGSPVGRVTALDDDIGIYAQISFSLDPAYEGKVPFTVASDGYIRTNKSLDRETEDRYEFKIVAMDKGIPALHDSVIVIVRVSDDNDEDPEIIFPKLGDNTAFVPFSTPQQKVVTQILAEDDDEKDTGNSRLEYAINYRNDTNLFKINPITGQIQLVEILTENDIGKKFRLDIFVSDHGKPVERTSIAPIYIVIIPSNQTSVPEDSGLSNQNLLIAIIVSVITVVVSVGIVATICIIRKIDLQKKQQNSMPKNNDQDNELKERFDGSITVFSLPSEDSLLGEKKKKEVSFSLEEDVFSDDDLIQKNGLENHRHYKASLQHGLQHGLQYHLPPKRVEDNHSETSGDTGTSDSGRGGSDEEIHNSFSYTNRERPPDITRHTPPVPPRQEIIPFSFKKGMSLPPHSDLDRERSRNKANLLQTDSGIHSDTNSNEGDGHMHISRDFVV